MAIFDLLGGREQSYYPARPFSLVFVLVALWVWSGHYVTGLVWPFLVWPLLVRVWPIVPCLGLGRAQC